MQGGLVSWPAVTAARSKAEARTRMEGCRIVGEWQRLLDTVKGGFESGGLENRGELLAA
jgi:hypothetical protein